MPDHDPAGDVADRLEDAPMVPHSDRRNAATMDRVTRVTPIDRVYECVVGAQIRETQPERDRDLQEARLLLEQNFSWVDADVRQLRELLESEHLHFLNAEVRMQEGESALSLLREERDGWKTQFDLVKENGRYNWKQQFAQAESTLAALRERIKQLAEHQALDFPRESPQIDKRLRVLKSEIIALLTDPPASQEPSR